MEFAIIEAGTVANLVLVDNLVNEDGSITLAADHARQLYPDAERLQPVDGEYVQIGWAWPAGGAPVAPEPEPVHVRPQIVVTSVTVDAEHAGESMVEGVAVATVPQGATLTVAAELRAPGGAVIASSDVFRMPLRATDGRERIVLARMTAGLISVTVPLRESGVWEISEAGINSAIPPENQMAFSGLKIFVVVA